MTDEEHIEHRYRYDRRPAMTERAVLAYGVIAASCPLQVFVRYLHGELRSELGVLILFLLSCGALIATKRIGNKIPPIAHVLCTLTLCFAVAGNSQLSQYAVNPIAPVSMSAVIVCLPLFLPLRLWEEFLAIAACAIYLLWLVYMRPVYLDAPGFTRNLAITFPVWSLIGILATRYLDGLRTREHRQRYEIARQKALAEQQRVKAEALARDLDSYAHVVAHDLKNPIGVIAGYNDLLATSLEDRLSDEERGFLASTEKGCEKMTQIINALLLLASVRKTGHVSSEPLDMSKIVGEARQRLLNLIDEAGAEVVLPERWPQAVGHPAWVEEVWTNYISNAIKYGGSPPRIELGAEHDGNDRVHFWVRDNGLGLSEEQIGKLFEEFSRVEPTKADGHGLGLSIVKRIVEKLGGEVRVMSTPGEGSTFGFTLPT